MNDLATLNGKGRPVTIDGVSYTVCPLDFADLAALQVWIESQFPDPFEAVRGQLDKFGPEARRILLAEAVAQAAKPKPRIGMADADALLRSAAGMLEILYLSIHKGDSTFTREKAKALFERLSPADLSRVLALSGADLVAAADPKAETTPTSGSIPTPTSSAS